MKTKLLTICLLLFTSQVYADEITFKLDVDANVRPSPCSTAVNFRVEKGSVLRIRKFADVHSGMIMVRWFKVKTIYGEGWISDQMSTTPSEPKLVDMNRMGCSWKEYK